MSPKDCGAFLKLNLPSIKKKSLATIPSFKINSLSTACRCLDPGPGARNTRWREQSLPSRDSDVQKNLSLALKAISKRDSKKVLSNGNNYNLAVIDEYSSNASTLKWYYFLMVRFCHIYQGNLSSYICFHKTLVWFYIGPVLKNDILIVCHKKSYYDYCLYTT